MELIKSKRNLGEKKGGDKMHKICLCPKSIAWIFRNLKKSSKAKFRKMIKGGVKEIKKRHKKHKSKKHRTAKQKAATRKLIAFNRRQ